jgi:phosphate-selective porin
MDMVDTSKDVGKGILSMYQKFDHIRISGYIQAQYQSAFSKGIANYSGGDFASNVSNRFMLRRGRIRFDYVHFKQGSSPDVQFVFQFDGTERGVAIRDFWGRVFENKFKLFSLTTGMFARPFSYELNLSSSDRESLERGRMSQILMKTERDLGAMVTFEKRKSGDFWGLFRLDAGFFNGQGLTSVTDFDNRKDFISRLTLKPLKLNGNVKLGAGISYLNGGMAQNSAMSAKIKSASNGYDIDSNYQNIGRILPRKYIGLDVQLKIISILGITEIRGEGMCGIQTASKFSSETPDVLLGEDQTYFTRHFNGAYFYLIHNLPESPHQFVLKFDWYDPNTNLSGREIKLSSSGITSADIKYSTLGLGYNYQVNPNTRLMIWYDRIVNENTGIEGFEKDLKDDILSLRMQFRF